MLGKIDRISITQEIIDNSMPKCALRCVIAYTLRSIWTGTVVTAFTCLRMKNDVQSVSYTHDSTVHQFINDFDNGVKVKPCVLVVDHYLRRLSIEALVNA